MRKRVLVLLMCVLLCFNLTGCGLAFLAPWALLNNITRTVEAVQEQSGSDALKATVAKNSVYVQSTSTAKAAKKAMAAYDKAEEKRAFWNSISWLPGAGWLGDRMMAHHDAVAESASNRYYSKVAADTTLQNSIKKAEGKTRVKSFSLEDIPTSALVIIVIFIILVALALLKNLKAKGKAIRKGKYAEVDAEKARAKAEIETMKEQRKMIEAQAKMQEQQFHSQLKLSEVKKAETVGTHDGQMALLQRQCAKRGLNPEVILRNFNNDPFAANEYILSHTPEQLAALQ